jgi:trehalose synthase
MRRIEARLQTIPVKGRALDDYRGLAPEEQIERAAALAAPLAGARVLYVGSVPLEAADASRSLAPLLLDLGLDVERALLHGDRGFQHTARELGDALRGVAWARPEEHWRAFREACEAAAVAADLRGYDVVVSHGPAAAALIEGRRTTSAAWMWRTGLDASAPEEAAWSRLEPLLSAHSALCFALPAFTPAGVGGEALRIMPGCFDPLAPAQRELSRADLAARARALGLDLSRPLCVQVGVLDALADPLAIIEAWRAARQTVPGLQLALTGRIDPSDGEAAAVLAEVRAFAGEAQDLHLSSDGAVADEDLNALCRVARCSLHSALAEEFEPALAASLWRRTAVIAGGTSARAQVRDGVDGFVVDGTAERAEALATLAADAARTTEMGLAGHEQARARFLVTRQLGDELELIGSVLGRAAAHHRGLGAAA